MRRFRSSSSGCRFPTSAPRSPPSWHGPGPRPGRIDRGRSARLQHACRAGARHRRQAEDAEVTDGGREVADVAAHEAEGGAGVRVAPAAAPSEAIVAEGARTGTAQGEGVVEA